MLKLLLIVRAQICKRSYYKNAKTLNGISKSVESISVFLERILDKSSDEYQHYLRVLEGIESSIKWLNSPASKRRDSNSKKRRFVEPEEGSAKRKSKVSNSESAWESDCSSLNQSVLFVEEFSIAEDLASFSRIAALKEGSCSSPIEFSCDSPLPSKPVEISSFRHAENVSPFQPFRKSVSMKINCPMNW
jgi:hypothetical protein